MVTSTVHFRGNVASTGWSLADALHAVIAPLGTYSI